jgi:nucleotide-binding universal stress UspA family protein
MKVKKILLPLESSLKASPIGPAFEIAKKGNTEIIALDIVPINSSAGWNYKEILKRMKNKKSEPLLNELEEWGKRIGVKVKKVIESGSPTKKIIEVAKREKVDLIIIGETKGFLGVNPHMYLIIKKACCPVLVIGENSRRVPCKAWNIEFP